jgi:hypothetical protein
MKLNVRRTALALAGLAALATVAHAAGMFSTLPIVGSGSFCGSTVSGTGGLGGITGQGQGSTGSICGQTIPAGPTFLTGSEIVPADTGLTGGAPPQTVAIPVPMLGNYWGTPRNFLDNGALNITNTNGTSTVTCAANAAITVTSMSADRWGCQANVGSAQGRSAIITSSPTPPAGFTNAMKVWRNSAALTQPVCVMQEVTTPQSVQLAGQVVTFSFYAAALAGLAADNNNVINAVVFTGTGTDQGLTTAPTASPAITPAWTGIATAVNQAITVTTTFSRYAVQATIPATATEIGVAICFTPTATGAGATDGFAWTGAQLERSPGASAFEFRSKSEELTKAQAFFYTIAEGAATTVRAMCMASSTTLAICGLQFPVTMYSVPAMTYTNGFATATTTAGSTLGACNTLRTSTLVTGNAASVNNVMLDCVATTVPAAGSADYLADNGGSGVIKAWVGM